MATHKAKTCGSAFFYLYTIRHIRKYLNRECTEKLIHIFILSRLDYCNSLLYGVPDHHMQRHQYVMNASARLIFCTPNNNNNNNSNNNNIKSMLNLKVNSAAC